MAGPTPISALIHAATMVAAGVYLLVRTSTLIELAPQTMLAIAIIGTATALAASAASFFQANFKKGIAYSTVAQLGYMFAAVGVGAPFAGLFHLFTHASFKALLFLAAGIVIHGASGREGLFDLRGLGRFFPYSRWGFLIGAAALIGTPLITSGSFSKDEIIEAALETQPVIGWLLIGAVLLTGLYIGRLFCVVYQSPATDPHAVHHEPAPERDMNWALVPLMVGAISFGWLGGWLMQHLSGTIPVPEQAPPLISPAGLLAFALGVIGFAFAWWLSQPGERAAPVPGETSYQPDRWVGALATLGYAASAVVSRIQSGLLARYAFGSFLAVAIVLLLRVTMR